MNMSYSLYHKRIPCLLISAVFQIVSSANVNLMTGNANVKLSCIGAPTGTYVNADNTTVRFDNAVPV